MMDDGWAGVSEVERGYSTGQKVVVKNMVEYLSDCWLGTVEGTGNGDSGEMSFSQVDQLRHSTLSCV